MSLLRLLPSSLRIVTLIVLLSVVGTPLAETNLPLTSAQVLATSTKEDWRHPDPANTLYMELPTGRVIIELAPLFSPLHVANLRLLAQERYWDGLSIIRVQDNYVAQWGDPEAAIPDKAKSLGTAAVSLPAEFERDSQGLTFTALDSRDSYAPEVGFVAGFPAARDPVRQKTWMAHCYGLVGAGRDNAADSSNGAELYAVIGHSPRHLDRNITPVGRVIAGIEHLSSLPRGPAPMGFYTDAAQYIPIQTLQLASQLPESARSPIEILRTDTPVFQRWIQARRERHDDWFVDPVGQIELCNIPIPTR